MPQWATLELFTLCISNSSKAPARVTNKMCVISAQTHVRGPVDPADSAAYNKQVTREMLALKYRCVRPGTGKPYIKSFTGGKNNSPEDANVSICSVISSLVC